MLLLYLSLLLSLYQHERKKLVAISPTADVKKKFQWHKYTHRRCITDISRPTSRIRFQNHTEMSVEPLAAWGPRCHFGPETVVQWKQWAALAGCGCFWTELGPPSWSLAVNRSREKLQHGHASLPQQLNTAVASLHFGYGTGSRCII